jgi:hypothetical protein
MRRSNMHTKQLVLYVITIAAFVFFTLNLTDSFTGLDASTGESTSAPRNASRHDTVLCQNADFIPQHKKAVWTMLTDDPQYVICALKLGHSLRAHTTESRFDMVTMELATKPLGSAVWDCLREVGWQRCVVDRIAPVDEAATRSKEPRWLDQFTKLHLWGMTMYDTLLYLDSDTLTLRSIDHLLNHKLGNKSIGVAAQTWHGMLQGFNMGVLVIHPSKREYDQLLEIQQDPSVHFEAHWAEQGLLNVVYKDKWDDIGFHNNALAWTS